MVIFLKADQAVTYYLIDHDPIALPHQAPCARLAANMKATLTREYVGVPDFSGPQAKLTLLGVPFGEGTSTTWLFDNGRIELENAFWANQCKVILSISRAEPDAQKMSILP